MICSNPHITVCICTYKRPEFLLKLLLELAAQKTADQFCYSAVVVDNDVRQSARVVVDSLRSELPFQLEYYSEPEQNIALARNKAIENANGDYIAFIDDDEFPAKDWLLNHLRFLRESASDGSLGPVLPYYEIQPPQWIIRGKFYCRPQYRTGKILRWVETRSGNVLLRRECFSRSVPPFDPIFGSGGEDKDFFKREIEQGRVFRWCAEAPVFERIPYVRCRRSFMIRRALLRGKVDARSKSLGIINITKSIVAIIIYGLALPVTIVFGHEVFMWTLIKGCDHLGKIATLCGINVSKERYVLE